MGILLLTIITVHGLIHLMGFFKAFGLAEFDELKLPITKTSGLLWLLTTTIFLSAAGLYIADSQVWWVSALVAIVMSQGLIFVSWSDAKYGSLVNLLILIPIFFAFLNFLPSSFQNVYRSEIEKRTGTAQDDSPVTQADLKHLPSSVRRYLEYVGVVGKPKVRGFRVNFTGQMKMEPEGEWVDIDARQTSFLADNSRFFYIESSIVGIPFNGLHMYTSAGAKMQIKVAALLLVVDAAGPEMNQSEAVTFFNDMCLLAPATLIDRSISWRTIDPLTVEARFTLRGNEIQARLYFNSEGRLVNFTSEDRYLSVDGKTYKKYKWSTPVEEYIKAKGRRYIKTANAIWHKPEGDYTYAKFRMSEVRYNNFER